MENQIYEFLTTEEAAGESLGVGDLNDYTFIMRILDEDAKFYGLLFVKEYDAETEWDKYYPHRYYIEVKKHCHFCPDVWKSVDGDSIDCILEWIRSNKDEWIKDIYMQQAFK